MLHWYAERLGAAKQSVFYTTAFSISGDFMNVLQASKPISGSKVFQRYILLESKTAQYLKDKIPVLKKIQQNRLAWGDVLRDRSGDEELVETLTGLNSHVNYLHTKYMLIDPLTDDPIVITGSANFSDASTEDNDENMLIIRGNTRVADIYLTEYMRLFNHFHSRNKRNGLSSAKNAKTSETILDDSWTKPYYGNSKSQDYQERKLFT